MALLLNLEHTKVNSTKDFDIIIEKIDVSAIIKNYFKEQLFVTETIGV
jgi:hypothetical protein